MEGDESTHFKSGGGIDMNEEKEEYEKSRRMSTGIGKLCHQHI